MSNDDAPEVGRMYWHWTLSYPCRVLAVDDRMVRIVRIAYQNAPWARYACGQTFKLTRSDFAKAYAA